MEGFGPFQSMQSYSLSKRGLVLIRGSTEEDETMSNGAGKTTLGFAPLWALTGQMDGRPFAWSDVGSVVNHHSTDCTVSLSGKVDGIDFEVVRRRSLSKVGRKARSVALEFKLGEEDLTMQSVAETQKVIEDRLGISTQLLARTAFHGQHHISSLLSASETDLRKEISVITAHEHWNHAAKAAKAKRYELDKTAIALQAELNVRMEHLQRLQEQEKHVLSQLEVDRLSYQQYDRQQHSQAGFSIESLKKDVANAHEELAILDHRRRGAMSNDELLELDAGARKLTGELQVKQEQENQLRFELTHVERRQSELLAKEQSAKESIVRFTYEVEEISFCPVCKQSLTGLNAASQHSLQRTRQEMEEEQHNATEALQLLRREKDQLAKSLHKVVTEAQVAKDSVEEANSAYRLAAKRVEDEVAQIEKSMTEARQVYNGFADALSSLGKAEEEQIRLKERLKNHEEVLWHVREEIATSERRVEEQRKEVSWLQGERDVFRFLESALQKDLQSAEMRNTLEILSRIAQKYLDMLSHGQLRILLSMENDKIVRKVAEALPDGRHVSLSLASLSGGQWRRCALAFGLAFTELAAHAGKIRTSLVVFDEPMVHLDRLVRRFDLEGGIEFMIACDIVTGERLLVTCYASC